MTSFKTIDITPENLLQETLFCIRDPKNPGFQNKQKWFEDRYREGLRMKIIKNNEDKRVAFIEYIPADKAWRPANAPGFMFIHCIMVSHKTDKGKGLGGQLLEACESDARSMHLHGICTMTSKGPWVAEKELFLKNGYDVVDQLERFELLSKQWNKNVQPPHLIDWTARRSKFKGWHLLYADQCPWHENTVVKIQSCAKSRNVNLNIQKIISSAEAKKAPSGFGVFNLIRDGKLLVDHYISETRFKNILEKELKA